MLAGLANSEITRAQYGRSLAAQQQSKAGDQWSYYQAKRLRSALQKNALDIVHATAEVHLDLAFLDAQAATDKKKKAGVQGYCMGGPFTVRTAAAVPAR